MPLRVMEKRIVPQRLERDIMNHDQGRELVNVYPHLRAELSEVYRQSGGERSMEVLHELHSEHARAFARMENRSESPLRESFSGVQASAARFEDAVRAYFRHGSMVTQLTDRRGWGRTNEVYGRLAQLPHDQEAIRLVGQAVRVRPESTVRSVQTRASLNVLGAHSILNPAFRFNPAALAGGRMQAASREGMSDVEIARRRMTAAEQKMENALQARAGRLHALSEERRQLLLGVEQNQAEMARGYERASNQRRTNRVA